VRRGEVRAVRKKNQDLKKGPHAMVASGLID
jgi:hypothetical protein